TERNAVDIPDHSIEHDQIETFAPCALDRARSIGDFVSLETGPFQMNAQQIAQCLFVRHDQRAASRARDDLTGGLESCHRGTGSMDRWRKSNAFPLACESLSLPKGIDPRRREFDPVWRSPRGHPCGRPTPRK